MVAQAIDSCIAARLFERRRLVVILCKHVYVTMGCLGVGSEADGRGSGAGCVEIVGCVERWRGKEEGDEDGADIVNTLRSTDGAVL